MYALAFGYRHKGKDAARRGMTLSAGSYDPDAARRRRYALSARSFSQADMPLGLALRLYDAFSSLVHRKWTCWVARSLAGFLGAPLRFGWLMVNCRTKIVLDEWCI